MATDIDFTMATAGAPAEGGCVYTSFADAPTLPTDATTALGADFVSLGEISENGFTLGNETSSNDIKGWHGKTIITLIDEEKRTYKLEFVEVDRLAVAQLRFGKDNVTADGDTYSAIENKGVPQTKLPLIIDELESSGYLRRTVIPQVQIQSIDDETHTKGSLITYSMTFNAIQVDGKFENIYHAKPATTSGASGGTSGASTQSASNSSKS